MNFSKLNMKHVDSLSGRQFEFYCAKLLRLFHQTAKIKVTQATNDHGVDVIMKSSDGTSYGIQCKHTHGDSIGYRGIEEIIAGMRYYHLQSGIVVTNGFFSKNAQDGAKRMNIRLINRTDLQEDIKDADKKPKLTTMKIDTATLDKVIVLQHILLFKNRTQTIAYIVDEATNSLISKYRINLCDFKLLRRIFSKDRDNNN